MLPEQRDGATDDRLEIFDKGLTVSRIGGSHRPAYLSVIADPWFATVDRDAYAEFLLERPADGITAAAAIARQDAPPARLAKAREPPCAVLLGVTTLDAPPAAGAGTLHTGRAAWTFCWWRRSSIR